MGQVLYYYCLFLLLLSTTISNQEPLPLQQLVKTCLLETPTDRDPRVEILIDVIENPLESPFYKGSKRPPLFSNIVSGRYLSSDPFMVYDNIQEFIGRIEDVARRNLMYIGIVDGSNVYYINETSTEILSRKKVRPSLLELDDENSVNAGSRLVNAFLQFGNSLVDIYLESTGSSNPSSIFSDQNWPPLNISRRLSKMVKKILQGRAQGHLVILPEQPPGPEPTYRVVITDGQRRTAPSNYPKFEEGVIFDLGGFWSATFLQNITQHNVLPIEYPQDLPDFDSICRFMICQSLPKQMQKSIDTSFIVEETDFYDEMYQN